MVYEDPDGTILSSINRSELPLNCLDLPSPEGVSVEVVVPLLMPM